MTDWADLQTFIATNAEHRKSVRNAWARMKRELQRKTDALQISKIRLRDFAVMAGMEGRKDLCRFIKETVDLIEKTERGKHGGIGDIKVREVLHKEKKRAILERKR